MGLFLFFTTLFGIAALLSSVLAYNFGFYSLGDWSIWMGWGGLTFFIFAVIGIGFKKALENIVFVVFKKFPGVLQCIRHQQAAAFAEGEDDGLGAAFQQGARAGYPSAGNGLPGRSGCSKDP